MRREGRGDAALLVVRVDGDHVDLATGFIRLDDHVDESGNRPVDDRDTRRVRGDGVAHGGGLVGSPVGVEPLEEPQSEQLPERIEDRLPRPYG